MPPTASVVRVMRFGAIALFVVSLALLLLFASQGRSDLVVTQARWTAVVLGVLVAVFLVTVGRLWLNLRRLARFHIVDTSASPAPLPDGLIQADGELRRLGFSPIGQYEIDTAWPEKAPRAYALFVFQQRPGVSACLSFATLHANFSSYWADGRAIETTYPSLDIEVPKGVTLFPDWILVQRGDDNLEAAYRLHLNAVAAAEGIAGQPAPVLDVAAAIAFEGRSMQHISEFHRAKLRPLINQALLMVPAWFVLMCLVFAIQANR